MHVIHDLAFRLVLFSIARHIVLGFTQRVVSSAADGPASVYTADLDNDGFLDVLSASWYDDKIAWYRNDGSGGFSTQHVISTAADGTWTVHAADLDNDGFLDVLSASFYDNKIAWYRNFGNATFSPQRVISTDARGARSVYAADLDNDGFLDVLSACESDDKIAWYRNDGSGGFSPQHVITTAADGALSVYAADLDNDGFLDVLSASFRDDKIAWYRNDGSGGFGAQHVISTDADGALSVYAADLDNDGFLDVLSASVYDNKVAWYRNDGNSSFSPQHVITTTADSARFVYAADLDNDGFLDVLSASEKDGKIAWYRNDGNSSFSPQHVITSAANGALSVYAADLDNDGLLDVLSASLNDDKIAWYRNDGSPNNLAEHVITTAADGPASVYTADLDNDGFLDVLSASWYDDKIAWYRNDGSGGFSTQHVISTAADGTWTVHAADLDNDGFLDVLSASFYDNKIAWYRNFGNATFSPQRVISTDARGARSVYAADLDNDGFLDVLSACESDDKIAWYRNDGSGGFLPQHVITTAADGALSVYAADLDNDGFLDVLSASEKDDKIAWYRNDGSGGFGAQHVISTDADSARSVYAADLDNDGFLDVLSASYNDNKVAWYRNDGSGEFTTQHVIRTSDGALSVYAADLDNDGFLDVLSASYNDDKIAWYRNDGSGGFSPQHVITSAADGALSVYAADLDNDGRLDVLSASFYDDKIAWYSLEIVRVRLQSPANHHTCTHSRICPGPISLRSFVLGLFHVQGHMHLESPWHFAAGYSVALMGAGPNAKLKCDTGGSVCLQFPSRGSVHLQGLEIYGPTHRFIHIHNVLEVILRNVHFRRVEVLGLQPVLQIQGVAIPPQQGRVLFDSVEVHDLATNSSVIRFSHLTLLALLHSSFDGLAAALEPRPQPSSRLLPASGAALECNAVENLEVASTAFRRYSYGLRAIALHSAQHVRLSHSIFEDIDCEVCHGAAILVTMKSTVLRWSCNNVTFRNNHAYRGGAIAVLDETSTLTPWEPHLSVTLGGLRFEGNSASEMGGALYWGSSMKYTTPPGASFRLVDNAPSLIMKDCEFLDNTGLQGGGLAVDNINVFLFNTSFIHNTGLAQGGGAWMKRASAFFGNCSWVSNHILPPLPSSSHTQVPESSILNPAGAGLFVDDCLVAGIVMAQSHMANNRATAAGKGFAGAVFVGDCSFIAENTTMISNEADHGGVAYITAGSSLQWRRVVATHNSATAQGGVLAASDSSNILLEDVVLQANQAQEEGGAVWVRSTPLHFRSSDCSYNRATRNTSNLEARGGCAATYDATVQFENTVITSNAAEHGVGGNLYLGCSASVGIYGHSLVANGSAVLGSNVMLECFAPGRVGLPALLLASGTVNSATVEIANATAPRSIVNAIAAPAPVALFHMRDAFGNFRWEDSSTVCAVSATGTPSSEPAVILSTIRFTASNGTLTLYPFSALASTESDMGLVVTLACTTAAGLEIATSITVPLVKPLLTWEQSRAAGFPSQRAALMALAPPLSLRILIGGVPAQEIQSFVCSVASLRPDIGSLIGTTTGTTFNNSFVAFPQLGVDADLGSTVPVQATCQLPSGAMYTTATAAHIQVANVVLQWDHSSLPAEYPLASVFAGSPLESLRILYAFSNTSTTDEILPCTLETYVPPTDLDYDALKDIALLSPGAFDLLLSSPSDHQSEDTNWLPHELAPVSVGIPGTNISPAPAVTMIRLRVRCDWLGQTVVSDTAAIPIMPMQLQWAQHTPASLDAMVNTPLSQTLQLQWPAFLPTTGSSLLPGNSSHQNESFSEDGMMQFEELHALWAQEQDLVCELGAEATIDGTTLRQAPPVAVEGAGRTSSWNPDTATILFSQDIRIIPSQPEITVGVALRGTCILNGRYRIVSPPLHVRFLSFTMDLLPASYLVLPSARSNILGVAVVAAVQWTTHSSPPSFWAPSVIGQCSLVTSGGGVTEALGTTTASLKMMSTTSTTDDNTTTSTINTANFPNVGLSAAPKTNISLTAECHLSRGGAIITASSHLTIVHWIVSVSTPAQVFRLEEVCLEATVSMPLVSSTPPSQRFPAASYFSEAMTCSLSALQGSTALTYPGNILTSRLTYVQGADHGSAAFCVRFDAAPGTEVIIQAACQMSERNIMSAPARVFINEFTAAWAMVPESLQGLSREWLPSSGTFLLPLQQPVPRIVFWSNQDPINDTAAINCDVEVASENISVSLMSPPALGYAGHGGDVALDRILIASAGFGVTVKLLTTCTRGAESVMMPPLLVSLPGLQVNIVPPLPPTIVITQRPFSILLQLSPTTSVVRRYAGVQCTLSCPAALALSGTVAGATNGSILFDSAAITGIIATVWTSGACWASCGSLLCRLCTSPSRCARRVPNPTAPVPSAAPVH